MRRFAPQVTTIVLILSSVMAGAEVRQHYRNRLFVKRIAEGVVARAGAVDTRSKVVALRDFLRAQVSFEGLPKEGRPFFRDSAADTIKSGRGYCGEVTRAFICMARELGIRAQRINLTGRTPHVVAEAEVGRKERVIVDSQNPPMVTDLEPLDRVMLRPEFDDYYTVNLRRLRLTRIVSRVKLRSGALTDFLENPHRIKAALWILLALSIAAGKAARVLLRAVLRRRGWVHRSAP